MSAMVDPRNVYALDFRSVESALPGHTLGWLNSLRHEALAAFVAQGLPTIKQEDWKYTSLLAMAQQRFPVAPSIPLDSIAAKPYLQILADSHRVVMVDGRFNAALSLLSRLPKGASVQSLAQALNDNPVALEGSLGHCVDISTPGFNALNTAMMSDGVFIHLAPGTVVEQPIEIIHLSTGATETAAYVRNVIYASENSHSVITETFAGLGNAAYLCSTITEVVADKNALIEHYKVVQEGAKAHHFAGIYVRLGRDSRYVSHIVALSGGLIRTDLNVAMEAQGADCELNGLYVAKDRQHVDNHTRVEHQKPHCNSREWYKGVLDDQARGVFRGRVVVSADAQKTDAKQTNNNLLLSENAEADSLPQLEIYADDVKCAHGTTIGQLDSDALFYLQSRAVDVESARSMLVLAFAQDVLARMKLAPLREKLERNVAERLLKVEHGLPRE